jgi:hypothetical protein
MRSYALLLALLVLPSCQRTDRSRSAADTSTWTTTAASAISAGDSARTAVSADSAQRADTAASR